MKRAKRIVIAAVVLVVLLAGAGVFWIDHLAKAGVEVGGTYALGTQTALDSASIGLVSGHSELSGLKVSNPPGFNSDYFLKLGNGALGVSLPSLTGDTVEVPELSLTGIEVCLEKKLDGANYKVIMDNLARFESGQEKAPEQAEGKKFVIRELVIKDVKVHVNLLAALGDATRVTVPINEVRLRDVGTADGGVRIAELTATILKAILETAVQKSGGLVPEEMLADLRSGLKNLESVKGLVNDLAQNAAAQVNELKQQAAQTTQQLQDKAKSTVDGAVQSTQQLQEKAKSTANEVTGGLTDILKKGEKKPSK